MFLQEHVVRICTYIIYVASFGSRLTCGGLSFAPSGLIHLSFTDPRLAPWAAFFRRFARLGYFAPFAAGDYSAARFAAGERSEGLHRAWKC
jgi:hypothetical protein